MSKSQEVALFGEKSDQLPSHLQNLDQNKAGMGNENLSSEDMAIPRLEIMQAQSGKLDDIAGAKPGDIYNTITGALYDHVFLINIRMEREFAIFKKRQLGGGYNGAFATREAASAHASGLPGDVADYDIIETAKHTCLQIDAESGEVQPVQLFMSGTKLGVSKNWNTNIQLKHPNAPRFASAWRLGVFKDSNTKGSWYNYTLDFAGFVPEELFAEAERFYLSLTGGAPEAAGTEEEAA